MERERVICGLDVCYRTGIVGKYRDLSNKGGYCPFHYIEIHTGTYIAGWNGKDNLKALSAAMKQVQDTANQMYEKIMEQIKRL